ncbi:hypothetical protein MRY87_02115 [bacterium]|nr:hypothetical protein [bacterium]
MRQILGISSHYHDAAAALVRDGEVVAAAQEERFTRRKHDKRLPVEAMNFCLEEGGVEAEDLDAIVVYDNPFRTLERVVRSSQEEGESASGQLEAGLRSLLGRQVWIAEEIFQELKSVGKTGRVLSCEHHFSHAASAFYPSPFREAALLTVDGVGEWASTTLGVGDQEDIELFEEIRYPHSLGLLYSAFTAFTGFKVNSGEYKLMGLAPYGEPRYADKIRDHLIDIKEDGSYRLNLEYFSFQTSHEMTSPRFAELFGGAARSPETRITKREVDLAASIQCVTEEVVLRLARYLRQKTGRENLCLAGGVALNCVANGKLIQEGIFRDIWIQPAAGDAGGALGAALHCAHTYFDVPRVCPSTTSDRQRGSLLGPSYSEEEILAALEEGGYVFHRYTDTAARAEFLAQELISGKIVGHFAGRMEFGPRALGGRSILGDPRHQDMQSRMNLKIKYRESFRPFAPLVLEERVGEYFDFHGRSPYMLVVAPVQEARRVASGRSFSGDLIEQVNEVRSDLPAITHVDYSARLQTVGEESNPSLKQLLEAFAEKTGCPVLVNTSFNVRGEPIVCSPEDALRCFFMTEMDILALEDFIVLKSENEEHQQEFDGAEYELD